MTSYDTPAVARRRRRLKHWIDTRHDGIQSGFVSATGINQGELSGLLRAKSFGEKRARSLEQAAGMPAGYLDASDGVAEDSTPISPSLSHDQQAILDLYAGMTREQRAAWETVGRALNKPPVKPHKKTG